VLCGLLSIGQSKQQLKRIGGAMAEAVARQLRDGVAVGEQAPAVMVRDTLDTRAGPSIYDHLFSSLCSNIEAGRAQAK